MDELFAGSPALGATLLCAHASRHVIDLNTDPRRRRGSTPGLPPRPRRSTSGDTWLEERPPASEIERRERAIFVPYHAKLEQLLRRKRERFGFAVLLCAHAYDVEIAPRAAEVVIGSRGRTTAADGWLDGVEAVARQHGRSVAHDEPFAGGYTVAHYGDPVRGVHALQVELRRALYVQRASLARDPEGFEAMRRLADALVSRLVEDARQST